MVISMVMSIVFAADVDLNSVTMLQPRFDKVTKNDKVTEQIR